MSFVIKYQATPYNHTVPGTLKIEASNKHNAWAVAFNELVSRGLAVDATDSGIAKTLPELEDIEKIRTLGVPNMSGRVHIRELHQYENKADGMVIRFE